MLILLIMLCLMFMFPLMKHPLSMGFLLILQTIMISLITGMMYNNLFMLSYILFITMLSGALVLFIYMASVASNNKFNTSGVMLFMVLSVLSLMLMSFVLMNDEVIMNSMTLKMSQTFLKYNQTMTLIPLFNSQYMMITLLLVLYLLFTMISVTYIVNSFEGPVRKKS
uniref:NADH dehydrogenase subunit 6 n=1 Tax=Gorpis humeralis TaxID=1041165 RepID=K7NBC7_9HEMI|nr:NADH dehydrogenase subunit 6 [Gorpis humeralis]AEH21210.1 NADH dehydrogenase subunit 6 [Gorpis humeralis]